MQYLTDFADQAVVLPVALAAALVFGLSRWWRGLAAWSAVVGGVLLAILVLKVVFAACSSVLDASGIRSPSGHTASACIVYGGIAILLMRGRVPAALLALIPVTIAALFGASRLLLQVHTPEDVLLGALVGMAGIAALYWLAGPVNAPPKKAVIWLMVAVLVIMGLLHGVHLEAEAAIRSFALERWLPMPQACHLG